MTMNKLDGFWGWKFRLLQLNVDILLYAVHCSGETVFIYTFGGAWQRTFFFKWNLLKNQNAHEFLKLRPETRRVHYRYVISVFTTHFALCTSCLKYGHYPQYIHRNTIKWGKIRVITKLVGLLNLVLNAVSSAHLLLGLLLGPLECNMLQWKNKASPTKDSMY
jgi:hypothetical protein